MGLCVSQVIDDNKVCDGHLFNNYDHRKLVQPVPVLHHKLFHNGRKFFFQMNSIFKPVILSYPLFSSLSKGKIVCPLCNMLIFNKEHYTFNKYLKNLKL